MLEYEDMSEKERKEYEHNDCNLLVQAEIKMLLMEFNMKDLDEDQILGKKKINDEYKYKNLNSMSIEEREFILDLVHRYPELSYKKLGAKYILEGEFSPLIF